MRKIVLASSLAFLLIMSGCGDRSAPEAQETLSLKSTTLQSDSTQIITDKDYTTVTLLGEEGSKVFINGKEVGTFPESGTLEVTFDIADIGTYTYDIYAKTTEGSESQVLYINVIKEKKDSTLGTVATAGKASALTVSKDGVIFVAEKDTGVEIISIGYDDKVSSDLLATIDTRDAVNVILSDDESKLYVEHRDGTYHLLDISDLSHPVEIDVVDEVKKSQAVLSEDGMKRYRVSACGLIGEDMSNPRDIHRDFLLDDKEIQDAVLVDNDTKLLVAHGKEGLALFDISDSKNPIMIGSKNLEGDTSGLSLLKKDGILFVANGAKGIEIFDLDILLHEMTR